MDDLIKLVSGEGSIASIRVALLEKCKFYKSRLDILADEIILYQSEAMRKLCSSGAKKGSYFFKRFGVLYSYNFLTNTIIRVDADLFPASELDALKRDKFMDDMKNNISAMKKAKKDSFVKAIDVETDALYEPLADLIDVGADSGGEFKIYNAEVAKKASELEEKKAIANTIGQDEKKYKRPAPSKSTNKRMQLYNAQLKEQNEKDQKIKEKIEKGFVVSLDEYIDAPYFEPSTVKQCMSVPESNNTISVTSEKSNTKVQMPDNYKNAITERDKVKTLLAMVRKKMQTVDLDPLIQSLKHMDSAIKGGTRQNIRDYIIRVVKSFLKSPKSFANMYLNIALLGPAGSGKTTVANCFGNILKNLGVLVSGDLTIHSRSTLVGQYVGETAIKTRQALTASLEGVMFIDEAYSICQTGDGTFDQFGIECINEIVGFLDKNKGKICVIVAGYKKEMNNYFFKVNSGLQRRFPTILTMKEFLGSELWDILQDMTHTGYLDLVAQQNLKMYMYQNASKFVNQAGDIENLASAITQEFTFECNLLNWEKIKIILSRIISGKVE